MAVPNSAQLSLTPKNLKGAPVAQALMLGGPVVVVEVVVELTFVVLVVEVGTLPVELTGRVGRPGANGSRA